MAAIWNNSSYDVWVVETDSTTANAHILSPGYRSPIGVDADGVKGYSVSISGQSGWWKTKAGATASLSNDGSGISIGCGGLGYCYVVGDNEFGNISYNSSGGWGSPIGTGPQPCFFTRALVDRMDFADDGDEMESLRELRKHLSSSHYGQVIIEEYEKVSAVFLNSIDSRLDGDSVLDEVSESLISPILQATKEGKFQQAIDSWRSLRSSLEQKLSLL
jgi:hypothetical protein